MINFGQLESLIDFLPIVFKKMFPMPDEATRQIEVSLIGKNQLTIPIAQNLSSQLYQVSLYYRLESLIDFSQSN
jgi:CPA2 family monovalent cation:H+ antiporter-2